MKYSALWLLHLSALSSTVFEFPDLIILYRFVPESIISDHRWVDQYTPELSFGITFYLSSDNGID